MRVEGGRGRPVVRGHLPVAAERDQGDGTGQRIFAQASRNFMAVKTRQPEIQKNQVGHGRYHRGHGFGAVANLHDLITRHAQQLRHGLTRILVVLDVHQTSTDRFSRRGPWFRRQRCRDGRKAQREQAALVRASAAGLHRPAVQRDQLLHQRQADAHAALQTVGRRRSLDEGFEDVAQQLGIHADPGIAHLHHRHAAVAVRRHIHRAAGQRELEGVGQQVVEDLLHAHGVAAHPHVLRANGDVVALSRCGGPHRLHAMVHGFGQVQRLQLQHDLPGHQAAGVQQVVDDAAEVPVLALEYLQRPLVARLVHRLQVQQGRSSGNGRQRVSEFMPQQRQELVLRGVLRLGRFACQAFALQQAFAFRFGCHARLALSVQQFACIQQMLVECVDFVDGAGVDLRRLATPQRKRIPARVVDGAGETSAEKCGRQKRRHHGHQQTGRCQQHGAVARCIDRHHGRRDCHGPAGQRRMRERVV